MDKQRVVNHDQLIQEFEELTTDLGGLLGVLEQTLNLHNGEANFEAKRLLCNLFQVWMKYHNTCIYPCFNLVKHFYLGFLY